MYRMLPCFVCSVAVVEQLIEMTTRRYARPATQFGLCHGSVMALSQKACRSWQAANEICFQPMGRERFASIFVFLNNNPGRHAVILRGSSCRAGET
jgi:hypothetical protein